MIYNHKSIEKKWQKKWETSKVFKTRQKAEPLAISSRRGQSKGSKKKKFYCLDMFPYPSGAGLHMGHAFVFSLGDIYARFKRMQGFNVLYPIGYDSLGLPAENAAIKAGTHPSKYTEKSIVNFMKQQKAMGWSYDWDRMVKTSDPDFYKWDQWIFLEMFKKGMAYRKKSPVNWCSKCRTVLANEQVINGKCWRHEKIAIEIKHLEQWYFKITDYAEELLSGLDKLDWPEGAKKLQRNWIGKSYGTEIMFSVNNENWPIFTTRPDTLYGVTFMVVSAQHPKLHDLVTEKQKPVVEKFLKKVKSVSEKEMGELEKEGVFTGAYAINPLTKEQVPIYAGNFVLADYGSGMVMAVPGHDKRDYDFAKKYKLKIKEVIKGGDLKKAAYVGEGELVNSDKFNGTNSKIAKDKITDYLKKLKCGKRVIQFKLRDWLISRQRYWGAPIPIVYCDKCGIVPLESKDLPVKLPEKVRFGKGNPLEGAKEWLSVKCPKCKGKARRETDTMDTFVNSSWYYLRYTDPKNKSVPFDPKKANYWCPVDQYIGGPEHVTMHLIYFRFYTKFLRDLGVLKFDEPALKYFTQGIVHGKNGDKMSKSKGNVVEPFDMINKYGADTLRLALVSFATPDKDTNWDEKIVEGSYKFLNNVYDYFMKLKFGKQDARIESKLHKAIKQVTGDVESFKHNLAIIKIRQLFQSFADKRIDNETAQAFLKLIGIYCPFIAEELWVKVKGGSRSKLQASSSRSRERKGFLCQSEWPKFNVKKINDKFEKEDEVRDKIVSDIMSIFRIVEARGEKKKNVYVYVLPKEKELFDEVNISERVGKLVKVYAVNDKDKYDPTNKSKGVKPGRPGIYLE